MTNPEENLPVYLAEPDPKNHLTQEVNSATLAGGYTIEISSLNKIRDILFGNYMREYDQNFARLEDRVIKECANLREETRKRLDTLENYLQTEFNSLSKRVNSESNRRDEAMKDLAQELKNLINYLDKKVGQLEQQTSQSQGELRQQLLDQSKNFGDELNKKYNETLVKLESAAEELRQQKTDRSTLAALLAELAVRLNSYQ